MSQIVIGMKHGEPQLPPSGVRPQLVRDGGREYWSTGWHVISWIENYCRLTNGQWLGQPFRLLPWQKRFIYRIFEVRPNGLRRYRRVLLGIPRKNGKTELAAALALYFMAADGEPAAEVYAAASSADQADRVFEAARRMVAAGPLAAAAEMNSTRIFLSSDPYSYISRLTGKGSTWHGLNIHAAILDELHTWTSDEHNELWSAIVTGSAARRQPMQIAITTAGVDITHSRCGKLYELGRAIQRGEQRDDSFYFEWWEAPPDYDYRDPRAWRAANPSLGAIVTEEYLASEIVSIPEPEFRRLYLNQWVAASDRWLPPGAWRQLADPASAQLVPGEPVWIGWDASTQYDSSAIVIVQRRPDGRLAVRARVWDRPLDAAGNPVTDWVMPIGEMAEFIRQISAKFKVKSIAYDPAFVSWAASDLAAAGYPMVEWPQTDSRMVHATKLAYEMIVQGKIVHDGDSILSSHIDNCAPYYTRTGGVRLRKARRGAHIDAAIAMIMAISVASHDKLSSAAPPRIWVFEG